MNDEVEKSIHMAIGMIAVVVLVVITTMMLKVGRDGWNEANKVKAIAEEYQLMSEFDNYYGNIPADQVINFIATYGTQFRYMYRPFNSTSLIPSEDRDSTDPDTTFLYNWAWTATHGGDLNSSYTFLIGSKLPMVPDKLIDYFEQQIIDDKSFTIRAFSVTGKEVELRYAKENEVILIEGVD